MATYLLTWNPQKGKWDTLSNDVYQSKYENAIIHRHSCGNNKNIVFGDRLFMMRQGVEPRGIMASGWVVQDVYQANHWETDKPNRLANYVDLQFDYLLDPEQDRILERQDLDIRINGQMHWDTQISGITIPPNIADQLEEIWHEHLEMLGINQIHNGLMQYPEQIYDMPTLFEGAKKHITVNSYERNLKARKMCIEYYGARCSICNFDFEEVYGEIGEGFIHVHHLTPISEISDQYVIDPISDLRPVCPNCHAMLHRSNPPLSIEALKQRMNKNLTPDT